MTDTLMGVSPPGPAGAGDAEERELNPAELAAVEDLVRRARTAGIALTGPDGLLKAMTKTVIEAALEEEISDHLGYDKHALEGRNRANSRNGKRSKTVLTDSCGEVDIDVPRDRDGTFEPQLVKKRQRRLGEVDEVVLSLYARGLTTGEISAHFADVYGASVSKDTVSRITDRVIGGDAGVVGKTFGEGLRRDLHRCDRGEDPRQSGPQPARLRRHRRRP
jgi:hypothetical protein